MILVCNGKKPLVFRQDLLHVVWWRRHRNICPDKGFQASGVMLFSIILAIEPTFLQEKKNLSPHTHIKDNFLFPMHKRG